MKAYLVYRDCGKFQQLFNNCSLIRTSIYVALVIIIIISIFISISISISIR